MPYIPTAGRDWLEQGHVAKTPGELNYQIARLIKGYIAMHNGLSYQVINDIIGVLECQKLEFYRRLAVPYEDRKILENEDVY
jgi:hypothetical protein